MRRRTGLTKRPTIRSSPTIVTSTRSKSGPRLNRHGSPRSKHSATERARVSAAGSSSYARPVFDFSSEQLSSLAEIVAGVEQALDLHTAASRLNLAQAIRPPSARWITRTSITASGTNSPRRYRYRIILLFGDFQLLFGNWLFPLRRPFLSGTHCDLNQVAAFELRQPFHAFSRIFKCATFGHLLRLHAQCQRGTRAAHA